MKRLAALAFALFCGAAAHAATPSCVPVSSSDTARHDTLTPFAGEDELRKLVNCLAENSRQDQGKVARRLFLKAVGDTWPTYISPEASATKKRSVGVDEGDIVKVHGRHLVILRDGQLFTVDIDKDRLQPVAAVNAFGPELNSLGRWYDEMLISGDTIAVIGYCGQCGGTEINLLNIDDEGRISYRATYHLRSQDYAQYESRLIGDKLVFYSRPWMDWLADDPYTALPALRHWHKDASPAEFKTILPATRIYHTDDFSENDYGITLHTLTVCDLAGPDMECQAKALMGSGSKAHYASASALYVWTIPNPDGRDKATTASLLYRIPFDGSAPTALKTIGGPIDRFSFHESADGYLNILVRTQWQNDALWKGKNIRSDTALLRISLPSLTDGRDSAPPAAYRALPRPDGNEVHNRFIGNYLLYGASHDGRQASATPHDLYVTRWDRPIPAQTFRLPQSIERIETQGSDAIVIGTQDHDLLFSSIRLGKRPDLASLYRRKNAVERNARPPYFCKTDNDDQELLGLPIGSISRAGCGPSPNGLAGILFLHSTHLKLAEVGTLSTYPGATKTRGRHASNGDWYGDARPLFLGKRIFALLGYELVEGRLVQGRIEEVGRVDFAAKN